MDVMNYLVHAPFSDVRYISKTRVASLADSDVHWNLGNTGLGVADVIGLIYIWLSLYVKTQRMAELEGLLETFFLILQMRKSILR